MKLKLTKKQIELLLESPSLMVAQVHRYDKPETKAMSSLVVNGYMEKQGLQDKSGFIYQRTSKGQRVREALLDLDYYDISLTDNRGN
jgi:hypothetical protein